MEYRSNIDFKFLTQYLLDFVIQKIEIYLCTGLILFQVWGDIELFTGRFDKSDEVHESFPVYTATRGGLKLFFNTAANRWIVSSNIDDSDVRAIGGSTPCPDQDDDWKVWNGIAFDEPSLEEPWSPYIIAPKVLECRPETFEVFFSSIMSSVIKTLPQ